MNTLRPFSYIVVAFVGIVVFCLFATVISNSMSADGKIKYCYLENNVGSGVQLWNLIGYREWRMDRRIGTFTSFEDAVKAANELSCKISPQEKENQ